MERLIITNGKLILPTGIEMGQTLICENGKIEQIIPNESYQPLVGDKVIDARQNYVSPGFIDMHIHGGGGHDFMDGTVEAFLGVAETHAKYGTTAMVPTTLTSTNEELMTTFTVYRKAKEMNINGSQFIGLHLEGPYFSPKQCGAQDPNFLKKRKQKNICHSGSLKRYYPLERSSRVGGCSSTRANSATTSYSALHRSYRRDL